TVRGQVTTSGNTTIDARSINHNQAAASASILNKLGNKGPVKGIGKFFTNIKNSVISKLSKPVGNLILKAGGDSVVVTVGAAGLLANSANSAKASVGPGGQVHALGNVDVLALAEDNFRTYASASAGDADKVSVGGAIAITDFANEAVAQVG